MRDDQSYVLVTPVRNEEATIGITLESVIRQTTRPRKWVIVSDGSIDHTDAIVCDYVRRYPFMTFLRLESRPERSFSSVVFATEAGIAAIDVKDYRYIGLLDADIRLPAAYYASLFKRFDADPYLGLAGGLVVDCIDGQRRPMQQTLTDVAGAVQLFRRECFDKLGGLIAIPEGGWDAITCLQARMHGYRTRTFPEIEVDHLKPRNISEGNVPRRYFALGVRDYALGNHILFELLKCSYRLLERPLIIGGLARLLGYLWCRVRNRPRALPEPLIARVRSEQLARLQPPALRRRARGGAQP